MSNKGNLYLIPSPIADDSLSKILTPQLAEVLPQISDFLVENVRTARRYLSSLKFYQSIGELRFSVLDKDTTSEALPAMMEPLFRGLDVGVISEAGCPGIADPGALAVGYAHQHQIRVIPLVGPSSIFLALMASGLNGQRFGFHGYLPVEKDIAVRVIRELEKVSRKNRETAVFIETPYRNNAVFEMLVKNLRPETLLTIAVDITGSQEMIVTRPAKNWIADPILLPKIPAVFLFLAAD